MNSLFSYVRDSFIPAEQASLLIGDLSIQRGYGIFDFFKTLNHVPIFLDDHLNRLYHSAAQLRLPVGKTREELKTIIDQLQQKNNIPDSGIRITLTGGYSPDGYSLSQPNLIITQQPLLFPISPECPKPFRLITWPHQRQLPETKTIDYLMAIWLQPYIREQKADDVLYHYNGVISECPRSNFFIVTADDTLVTPARNMLKGITRMKVLELAGLIMKTEERDITLEELPTVKEAFITSTGKHIVPVSHIDDIKIGLTPPPDSANHPHPPAKSAPGQDPSAGPTPGPITKRLNEQLFQLVMPGNPSRSNTQT
jgi:D-alanine transaminase/branched-chain amino acid aminotransferase